MKKLANLANQIRFIEEFESYALQNRNYIFRFDPNVGYYLSHFKDFKLPEKLYDEDTLVSRTNRIKSCFDKTKKNLGVLLSGLKGTGKSVQMKHIAANSGMPVIVIDSAYPGSEILTFLNDLSQPCVVLIDEFEKIYIGKEQNEMLPLLDGIASSKHIFVLTTNSNVSEFLNGRPSRIRYNIKYSKLPEDLITEIVDDNLEVADKRDRLLQSLNMIEDINVDTILSLINEINNFPDMSYDEIVKIFNLEDPLSGQFDFFIHYNVITTCGNLTSDQDEKIYTFLGENKISLYDLYSEQIQSNTKVDLTSISEKLNNFLGVKMFNVRRHCKKIHYHTTIKSLITSMQSRHAFDLKETYHSDVPFKEDVLHDIGSFSQDEFYDEKTSIDMENGDIMINTNINSILCKPVAVFNPKIQF